MEVSAQVVLRPGADGFTRRKWFIAYHSGIEDGTYLPDLILRQIYACKRTQHRWPTTPNSVGCYMLRPFVHPVACCYILLRVVAQSLKPVKLLATYKRTQQLPTMLGVVGQQCCIRFHKALHYITVPKHNNWTSMQVIAFFSFITSRLCGCPLHFIKKLWGQTSC